MSKPINLKLNEDDIVLTISMLTAYRDICDDRYEITGNDIFKTDCMNCAKLIEKFVFTKNHMRDSFKEKNERY